MKRIFVMAYLRNNFGDDLFVSELIDRYPKDMFYIDVINMKFAESFKDKNNVEITLSEEENFRKIDVNKYDGYVYIGGSIFMEGGKVYNLDEDCFNFVKKCKEKNKPFFYISSNYGPYKTEEYFNLSKKNFEHVTDICFRDRYSHELFKDIEAVRYAPDLLFSYEIGEVSKEKDTVGISVIDLEIRDEFKSIEKEYIEFLVNNINNYLENNKKVYLFSFCKEEGDEVAIQKILESLKENNNYNNICVVKYLGNIKEFLKQYMKMEYMICQRFHSVILSYICKQKYYIISYSKKICNIIEDLKLCDNYLKLMDVSPNKIIELKDFNKVDEVNLKNIKNESKKQFEKLDEFLCKKEG